MKVQKGVRRSVYSSKKIKAEDEIVDEDIQEEATDVMVDPEATELVFEAEDVAELLAEATGEEVAVTVDTDAVVFTVGEDEFTVEPDGDEEILESSRKVLRGKKDVKASRKVPTKRAGAARPLRRR